MFEKVKAALEIIEAGSANKSVFSQNNTCLNRAVEKYISELFTEHYLNKKEALQFIRDTNTAPHLTEAYYCTRSLTSYKKLVRELKAAQSEFNVAPILEGVLKLEGMAERVKAAKAAVATPTQLREAKERATQEKKRYLKGTVIAACINAQREGYVANYLASGTRKLNRIDELIAEGDEDFIAKFKASIVDGKLTAEHRAAYLKAVEQQANDDVDAYIAKMVTYIGEVETAELDGQLWSYSSLIVTKDGEKQVHRTRCIINVSKYGKLFNQWPTRRIV